MKTLMDSVQIPSVKYYPKRPIKYIWNHLCSSDCGLRDISTLTGRNHKGCSRSIPLGSLLKPVQTLKKSFLSTVLVHCLTYNLWTKLSNICECLFHHLLGLSNMPRSEGRKKLSGTKRKETFPCPLASFFFFSNHGSLPLYIIFL